MFTFDKTLQLEYIAALVEELYPIQNLMTSC